MLNFEQMYEYSKSSYQGILINLAKKDNDNVTSYVTKNCADDAYFFWQ